MTTSGSHLLLQSLQRFKLQAGQSDLDVFGNVWDEEAQDELEGQQHMLKKSRGIRGVRTEEEAAELNMRGGRSSKPPAELLFHQSAGSVSKYSLNCPTETSPSLACAGHHFSMKLQFPPE